MTACSHSMSYSGLVSLFSAYTKCLTIATVAKIDQPTLKYIMVGKVFIVEVKIKAKLEAKANTNNHHHCLPNKRPGNIIASFVENAQNSIMLVLFQYFFSNNFFVIAQISL